MKSFFILLFALAPVFWAFGRDTNLLSRLEPVPPLLELRTVAKTKDIPLEGIGPLTATNVLPGDSLTALITLHQKRNRLTQWLVYFEVVGVSNQPPSRSEKPVVLYNTMGDKFEFPQAPVAFRIRTIGPYLNSASILGAPAAKDNYGRISVNGTFLVLGMEGGMAALYRLNPVIQKTGATDFDPQIAEKPFPDTTIRKNQKFAALLHITPSERRALAVGEPALMSYFASVGQTPDLENILFKVVSLPSIWSILKHRGVTVSLDFDVKHIRQMPLPAGWDLPGQGPVYSLPLALTLNEKPALYVTLIITSPSPSLVACGGIAGFVAQNPSDDQNYLTFRVISAQRGKRAGDIKGN